MLQQKHGRRKIIIEMYETTKGDRPFVTLESKLSLENRGIVRAGLNRIRMGNFGDVKPFRGSKGISEIIFHVSAEFRIYYTKKGDTVIILLCAGKKDSQSTNIQKAQKYRDD